MNETQLYELIAQLNTKENVQTSNDSISWRAYRSIECISDASVFAILIKIIEQNHQQKNKDIRRSAYYIIGTGLHTFFRKEACIFLIQKLGEERDTNIISEILDRISCVTIQDDIDISLIVTCSKSKKWQIRHSAIRALGSVATKKNRDALLYYINQDDEKKYKYEIIYSNASLGIIGTSADIPLLEKHANSRIPDICESARFAIDRIKHGE